MRELSVYFGNKKIKNEEEVDLYQVQLKPKIKFNIPANKYYTLIMVDPDAPSILNPINKYWLHWMVISNNETIVNFQPPNPPPNTGKHRYYIYLLEQQSKIETIPKYDRKQFSEY